MTLHWFEVSRFQSPAEALAGVEPFGVRMGTPMQESARFYWSEDANGVLVDAGIHRVFDDGRIEIQPYSCLPTPVLTIFISAAGNAFNRKASAASGWTRARATKTRQRPFWYSHLVIRADGTRIAGLVRAARELAPTVQEVERLSVAAVEDAPAGNPTWSRILPSGSDPIT